MANNGVSQHFKIDGGLDVSSDSQFATLSANQKIVYKPSGEKYIKNANYSNVFDKTDTFGDLESSLKANAVRRIENTNNPDGTTDYYSIDGAKLGSFKSGVSPNDLNAGLDNVRSISIASIDDADGNGVCSCKNTSGAQIDTFTCHIPVSNHNSSLNWGQQSTIGYVDGKALTINMPANPNIDTKYSAGTGLTLSGTTFSISPKYLNGIEEQGSNYIRYSNGLQICWYSETVGFYTTEDNETDATEKTYIFPKPFKDNSYAVIGAAFCINNVGEQFVSKYPSYITVTYNTEYTHTRTGGYLAIGIWK